MKAIVHDEYGEAEVLRFTDVERPEPGAGQVLLRVRAASLHPGDWMVMRGRPYVAIRPAFGLRRPRKPVLGFDVAGVVESVGEDVARFAPGDEVFGTAKSGSCAEYALADEKALAPKPAPLDFAAAATLPISGCAALHGIRDAGRVHAGQRVLVNGASGGVGTFAVQIAAGLGAEVTAVCSAANAQLVRSIGADHVIDYAVEDFTGGGPRYDLVLDNVGNHSLRRMRRAVAPGGRLIPNNGTRRGRWFGTLGRIVAAVVGSVLIRRQGRPFVSAETQADLADLAAMVDSGTVSPVVGATYPLADTAAAMREIGGGHARGKVVITVT